MLGKNTGKFASLGVGFAALILLSAPVGASQRSTQWRPGAGAPSLQPQALTELPPQAPGSRSRAIIVMPQVRGWLQAYAELRQQIEAGSRAASLPGQQALLRNAEAATQSELQRLRGVLDAGLRRAPPSAGAPQTEPIEGSNVVKYQGPMPVELQARLQARGYRVFADAPIRLFLEQSTAQVGAQAAWTQKDAQGKFLKGTGVRIAIIDSGIDYTHPSLGGCTSAQFLARACAKVIDGFNFTSGSADILDDHGHGTHVAGIAAGTGQGTGGFPGVAPEAKLIGYKVIDSSGSGDSSAIIEALYRAMDPNQDGDPSDQVDVINLSVGALGNPDDPLSQAVDTAAQAGIVVAVAAGNDGMDQSINSPGTARLALTVGAVDGQDRPAYFSSRGPVLWLGKALSKPDLVAPGVSICAPQGAGAWGDRICGSGASAKRVALSGTSMATPHVAGAAALLKQKWPGWSGLKIRAALIASAQPLPNASAAQVGAGRLRLAIALAQRPTGVPIVSLDPISTARQRFVRVQGSASGQSLARFSLLLRRVGSTALTPVVRQAIPGRPDAWAFDESIDVDAFQDGDYEVTAEVTDLWGTVGRSRGYLRIQKLLWSEPAALATYRSGDRVRFESLALSGSQATVRYEVSTGIYTGSPSDRISRQWTPISGTEWLTSESQTQDQWFSVRAIRQVGTVSDTQVRSIYFDSRLRKGFPVRVKWDCNSDAPDSPCFSDTGRLKTVLKDLNGDGQDEILFVTPGMAPLLQVLASNGSPLWSRSLGNTPMQSLGSLGPETHPVAVTKGPSGQLRIFAFNTRLSQFTQDGFSEIYGFDSSGATLPGFPLRVPRFYWLGLTVADLDRDGSDEMVLADGFGTPGRLQIYSWDGKLKTSISTAGHCWNKDGAPAAVARFSGSAGPAALVVANHQNCENKNQTLIEAFSPEGKPLPGWPRTVPGAVTDSIVAADLDGDGSDEVIASIQYDFDGSTKIPHLHSFRSNGSALPGFPALIGQTSTFGSGASRVAVGDLTGDGEPEIALWTQGAAGKFWQVVDSHGKTVAGYPKAAGDISAPPIVSDLNGDRSPEFLQYEVSFRAWLQNGVSPDLMATLSDAQTTVKWLPRIVPPNPFSAPEIQSTSDGAATQLVAVSQWDSSRDAQGVSSTLRRSSLYLWDLQRVPGTFGYSPGLFDNRPGSPGGDFAPSWTGGKPREFYVYPPLPSGFELDSTTGVIRVVPAKTRVGRGGGLSQHWVVGSNEAGQVRTQITVRSAR